MRVDDRDDSRPAIASLSSPRPPERYSSTSVCASSDTVASSCPTKATCITPKTTSPSSARPIANVRKFANAIRYAALRRQLRIASKAVADTSHRLDQVDLATLV